MKEKEFQKKPITNAHVNNCNFTGVKWDGQAIEAVNATAQALLNLTKIFIGQNIKINSMLSFSDVQEKAGVV